MKPGTCVHYTGMRLSQGPDDEPCCKAGVNYRDAFDNSRPGIFLRAPCIAYYVRPNGERAEKNHKGETVIPCALRREPSPEEIEAHEREFRAAMDKHIAGMRVAASWRVKGRPAADRSEVVECPVCKGKLHLHQFAINGHVHGRCETPKCVQWLE